MGPAEGVPSSDSRRLPLKLSTVWSTVMEPPTMGLLPPACSYWVRKLTASAPPSTTSSASTSPGSPAMTEEQSLPPRGAQALWVTRHHSLQYSVMKPCICEYGKA